MNWAEDHASFRVSSRQMFTLVSRVELEYRLWDNLDDVFGTRAIFLSNLISNNLPLFPKLGLSVPESFLVQLSFTLLIFLYSQNVCR